MLHLAYTSWSRDMELFVEQKRWRPTEARDELLRINTALFKVMLEAIAGTFLSGGVEGTINAMSRSADRVAEAVARAAGAHVVLGAGVLGDDALYPLGVVEAAHGLAAHGAAAGGQRQREAHVRRVGATLLLHTAGGTVPVLNQVAAPRPSVR